jgi:hypothetical protein
MHYKCTKCGCDRIEYALAHPCPLCGCTVLMFEHIGLFGHPNHWITMDVITKEVFGPDLCDSMPYSRRNNSE